MDQQAIFPFSAEADTLQRYCKLPLHSGVGKVTSHGSLNHPLTEVFRRAREAMGKTLPDLAEQPFTASFLVPANDNCLLFLRWSCACPVSRNFGQGLAITGDCPDGAFHLECPQYYVRVTSGAWEEPGWAVAAPINQLATVTYGAPRPVAKVTATINNFDFDYGNLAETGSKQSKVLRVEASGRTVDFAWRNERVQLRRLVDARIISSTALVTFTFAAWLGASDCELTTFAYNVASLCSYVVRQHTGIPVLSFFDSDGRVVRRTLVQAIQSKIRPSCALPCLHSEDGLPKLFRQCFDEHVKMQQSNLWKRLPWLCAGMEDPPYLEQKCATLMSALELLIRSSLIEGRHYSAEELQKKKLTFPELIGAARKTLGWDIPPHYTAGERYRLLRNAVSHGG
ncbi:MAG TPA: hypothetical protein VMG10_25425 [Gemmataceae bacterium]|nr:hypothetical protein [Gemmataceae bacterium]